MLLDKVMPFWTEEELLQRQDLAIEQQAIFNEMDKLPELKLNEQRDEPPEVEAKRVEYLRKTQAITKKNDAICEAVEERYIKSFARTKERGILADIKEIVTAVEKADFSKTCREKAIYAVYLKKNGATEEQVESLRVEAVENYENCYNFISRLLRVQFKALEYYGIDPYKAEAIIDKRVSQWYIKPQPDFLPLAHGKATDDLAYMSSKRAEIDPISRNATIEKLGTQLVISKLEELQTSWGVSTDKLFSTALANFTKNNGDFRLLKGKDPNRKISFPLREYANCLGYDVEEHTTNTPEEAEREKKRAKNQLDNVRKAVKKDLETIQASTLTWEEPIKGKVRDFARVSLVTYTGIRSGEIQISLSPEIAGYLAERDLITQYPTKLLKLDSRKPTAYYLGRKLTEYYNIDNNQLRGTQDRISIPALLAVTNLPTFEEVQATDRGHWENRIKIPFEEALDELTREGILKNWEYTHAKGIPLTDEEAESITSYKDFASLYLLFDPADKVNHEERIEEKQKRRAEQAKRAQTGKRARQSTPKE